MKSMVRIPDLAHRAGRMRSAATFWNELHGIPLSSWRRTIAWWRWINAMPAGRWPPFAPLIVGMSIRQTIWLCWITWALTAATWQGCIGGPYIMGLIQAAPQRIASAVIFQTIGLDNNRQAFYEMFDNWAQDLKPKRPEVSDEAWESFKHTMYDGEFLFNVSREFVAHCQTPMLVCWATICTTRRPRRESWLHWHLTPRSSNTGRSPSTIRRRNRPLRFLTQHTPR